MIGFSLKQCTDWAAANLADQIKSLDWKVRKAEDAGETSDVVIEDGRTRFEACGGRVAFRMKQLHVTTRSQWRRWLAENHAGNANGIWLIFSKQGTGRPSLEYKESVALLARGEKLGLK